MLTCKLYDVDREINFLQFVTNEWLSQAAVNRELLLPQQQQSPTPITSPQFGGDLHSNLITSHQQEPFQKQPIALAHTSHLQQLGPSVNLYSQQLIHHYEPHYNSSSSLPSLTHSQSNHYALPLVISTSTNQKKGTSKGSANTIIRTTNSNNHKHNQPNDISSSSSSSSSHQSNVTPLPQLTTNVGQSSSSPPITDPNLQNVIFLVDSLRDDVDILIGKPVTQCLMTIKVKRFLFLFCSIIYNSGTMVITYNFSSKSGVCLCIHYEVSGDVMWM